MKHHLARVGLLVPLTISILAAISLFPANSQGTVPTSFATQTSTSPDFSITASPSSIVQNGANFNVQIQVSSLNGFTGTVDLSVTTNSTSISCSLSPKNVNGGSGASYLSCSSSVSGTYLVTVTGTSGTLSRSANVTEYYPPSNAGFVIQVTPANITDTADDSGYVTASSDVIVVPLVSFQSGVYLTLATNSTHLACNLTPNVYFPAGTEGATGLWCTADAAGNYLANITAQGGTVTHYVTVEYHIQDFLLTAGTQDITIDTGSTGASTITLTPLNGFNMNITLSLSNHSSNLFCSLSQSVIVGGSGTATLSCNGTAPGNYVASVMTSSGHRSQILVFSYNVVNPSILGISPTQFYLIIGVLTTAALVLAFLLFRGVRLDKAKKVKKDTLPGS